MLRLLPRTSERRTLEELGMPGDVLDALRVAVERSSGLILISGPTGSGKTTTLHAALAHINDGTRQIVTIEDPVEYRLDDVEQIQTNESAGLTFDTLLRRVLRQDPNVIMVGEIRDGSTAALSLRAALTGHLVLATVHSRSAAGVRRRLLDLGAEARVLDELDPLLIAQRLIRTRCVCRTDRSREPGSRRHPCSLCGGTGLRGRTGLFEMIWGHARVASLENDASRKVEAGTTTIEEVSWALGR